MSIPASGRRVAVKGVVIDYVKGGMMAESRILMDSLGLLQQIGAIPTTQ
jgi:hypothetical protein